MQSTEHAAQTHNGGKQQRRPAARRGRCRRQHVGSSPEALSSTEATIAGVWARVLQLPPRQTEEIGTSSDFHALGGDSLSALRVVRELLRLHELAMAAVATTQGEAAATCAGSSSAGDDEVGAGGGGGGNGSESSGGSALDVGFGDFGVIQGPSPQSTSSAVRSSHATPRSSTGSDSCSLLPQRQDRRRQCQQPLWADQTPARTIALETGMGAM